MDHFISLSMENKKIPIVVWPDEKHLIVTYYGQNGNKKLSSDGTHIGPYDGRHDIISDGLNSAIVTWEYDYEIYANRINNSGTKLWGNNGIVVYNPVDLSKFSYINKKAMKRKLGINDNCKVVLYVGGYKLIKGPLVFVNALDKIITKIPDVKFLLPSTLNVVPSSISKKVLIRIAAFWRLYSTRQKVERVIEKYNIKNLLIMSNYSNHIEEYYAASDVAVIPFTKPHFARPVIEAGAAAIPVVASRIGGITEVVGDGKNGFLFTPGNSDELADKVIKCLKDENLASKMGNEGYGIAKSRYNSSIHASKISRLYSSI